MRRQFSRRQLMAGAGAGLAVWALPGCSLLGIGDEEGPDPDAEVNWDEVEPADRISFWSSHPGGSLDLEHTIAEAFYDETEIRVDLVTGGQTDAELAQAFLAAAEDDAQPDLALVSDVTWFSLLLAGALLPLDQLWGHLDLNSSDFHDVLLGSFGHQQAHYALPYTAETPVLYYNRDHFARAKLPDAAPGTWDDLAAMAPKLTRRKQVEAAFAFPGEDRKPAWSLANLVWGFGGAWSNQWDFSVIDGPETTAAMQWIHNAVMVERWGVIAPAEPEEGFLGGTVSATVQSSAAFDSIVSGADFDVGVGPLPGGPQLADAVAPAGGTGLAIAAASSPERQLAAAKFLKFLTSTDHAASFVGQTGSLPVRKSLSTKKVPTRLRTATEQLGRARQQDLARTALPGGDAAIAAMCQSVMSTDAEVHPQLAELRATLENIYTTDVAPELEG